MECNKVLSTVFAEQEVFYVARKNSSTHCEFALVGIYPMLIICYLYIFVFTLAASTNQRTPPFNQSASACFNVTTYKYHDSFSLFSF